MKIGIIGCGNISGAYFRGCGFFSHLSAVACADMNLEAARRQAREWNIPRVCSVAELLADPEIELVVNLSIPAAHAPLNLKVLESGKHVYVEKPFAVERDEAGQVLVLAGACGLRVGGAPDTFLGGGIQTCINLIDAGCIGEPVAATAFMMISGHEHWHPNPAFFYQKGGGPLFDMGTYYLTALIALLGPVRRVTSSARITHLERTAEAPEIRGLKIPVETPTHVAAVLDFCGGPVATLVTSYDIQAAQLPNIEIYGTEGTLQVPDPNTFDGPVFLRRANQDDWEEQPVEQPSHYSGRCLGVADMVEAIRNGGPHRASGEMAYHVLDVMQGILESSQAGRHVSILSTCTRPQPVKEY